jgi:2-(1,2-epoxy-1,2-dihydrophenyl)acetyl-CoA isomerase
MPESYQSAAGLTVERDDVVLRLTLDRPDQRNAITDESMLGLIRALETASTDDELRVVLLTAVGEHFCGGFDIVGRNAERDRKPRTGSIQRRLPTQANRLIPLLLQLQLPVVCAARGWAVGIGAQLVAGSDFAVLATDARIWYPFIKRGFTPDSGSTWLLPRLVGPQRARELLILGRELSGAEAVDWGLAHQAVESADVATAAEELTQQLAATPTAAVGLTKMLLNASPDRTLHAQLADEAFAMELSSRSPDFREGLRALAERRDPDFEGR